MSCLRRRCLQRRFAFDNRVVKASATEEAFKQNVVNISGAVHGRYWYEVYYK